MTSRRYVLPVLAQTRIFVVMATLLALLYVRSWHMLYFLCGSILTTLLAKALKNILRHPRPLNAPGYGMPSSHSQAIAFFATYIHLHTDSLLLRGLAHLFALAVYWSRIQLKHHTLAQVLAGAALGTVAACGWTFLWSYAA